MQGQAGTVDSGNAKPQGLVGRVRVVVGLGEVIGKPRVSVKETFPALRIESLKYE